MLKNFGNAWESMEKHACVWFRAIFRRRAPPGLAALGPGAVWGWSGGVQTGGGRGFPKIRKI